MRACHDHMLQRGFPPAVVTRAMRGGHFGVLRMIATFDKKEPREVESVSALNRELAIWRSRTATSRLLDPAGILNPGCWTFDLDRGRG